MKKTKGVLKNSRKLSNAIILYCLGVLGCTPALLSAFFEFPWRGWVDANETYFVMGAMTSTIFFFASFYNLKLSFISHIELYFVTMTAVFLSIPDIMLTTLDKIGLENREPSYSVGAITVFIIASILFSYICILNYQANKRQLLQSPVSLSSS